MEKYYFKNDQEKEKIINLITGAMIELEDIVYELVGEDFDFAPLQQFIEYYKRKKVLLALLMGFFNKPEVCNSEQWRTIHKQFKETYKAEISEIKFDFKLGIDILSREN